MRKVWAALGLVVSMASMAGLVAVAPSAAAIEPPIARDDAYTAFKDQMLFVEAPGLLGNDTVQTDGSLPPPQVQFYDLENAHGVLSADEGGSFYYFPEAGFEGTATFTYRVNVGDELVSNKATVVIEVGETTATTLTTSGMLIRSGGPLGLTLKLFGAAARLVAEGPDGPQPVAGATVRFTAGSTAVCTAVTDDQGQAACSSSLYGAVLSVVGLGATATYDGGPGLAPTSAKVPLIK
jgi:hypothetical protein